MPVVTYKGVAPMLAAARAAMGVAVAQSAEALVAKAQAETPVDTGTLRASIHVESVDASATEVTAKVATGGEASDYAVAVHEGSAPHLIKGNPYLAFNGVVVRSVNHPGNAPTKFLERPLIEHRALHQAVCSAAMRGAF